jgi:hypothetical protein
MANDDLDLDQYQIIGEPKGGGKKKEAPVVSGIKLKDTAPSYPGYDLQEWRGDLPDNKTTVTDFVRQNIIPKGVQLPDKPVPAASLVDQGHLPMHPTKISSTFDTRPIDVPAKVAANLPATRTDNLPAVRDTGVRPLMTPRDAEAKVRAGGDITNADLSAIYGGGGRSAEATPLSMGGGTDIAAMLKEYLGPTHGGGAAAGINPLSIPTQGGLFNALFGLASVMGAARSAKQEEAKRFHRGTEMIKLVSDIMEKNRGYGLNLRKQEAEEPYLKAQTAYATEHAGLAKTQAANVLTKTEQLGSLNREKVHAEAVRSADAALARDPNIDWREAYDRAYNAGMRIDDSGERNKTLYSRHLAEAKKAKMSDEDIYSSFVKSRWSDEMIRNAGGKVFDRPPVEGAKKAPDGKWYVQKDGKTYLVE